MKTITIDTEKVLTMCVSNADRKENSLCGDNGQIIINTLEHIDYIYPSPGTYYQNCHMVDPEDLLNIEAIEENYELSITQFFTDARDAVRDENGKGVDDELTDKENNTVSEYVNQYISEWKEYARLDKKDVLKVEDAEGTVINEYKIEWV